MIGVSGIGHEIPKAWQLIAHRRMVALAGR
jgi:hypothetical protein